MALKLDNTLLQELGLGSLPDSEKQLLLRQIYERLEMNVGMRLADQMSNEQLDAFEKFVDANDDKGAFQWLETNFPNYKDVVNEEFEKLKNEIRSVAPQILASVQAQQAQPGAQQPTAQPQMPPQAQGQDPYAQQPPAGYAQPAPQPAYGSPAPQSQQPPMPQGQPQYGAPAQPDPAAAPMGQPMPGGMPQYGAPGQQPQYPQPQQPTMPPQGQDAQQTPPPAGPPPQAPQQ
jgi:hypothetical protein